MKIRLGFVSNSSSSSFVITYKTTEKELRNKMKDVFKLPDNYPLKDLVNKIAETITGCIQEKFSTQKEYKDYVISEWGEDYINEKEFEDNYNLLGKGFTIATGSFASDSENMIEVMLCETDLNYKGKDFIINHEGGF